MHFFSSHITIIVILPMLINRGWENYFNIMLRLGVNMRIGIIDSGINAKAVNSNVIQFDFIEQRDTSRDDLNGHGTMAAKVIEEYAVNNVEIVSAKIFDEKLNTSLKKLYCALDFLSNQNLNLINMSISISSNTINKEIKNICNKILNQGTKIVSSYSNYSNKTAMDQIEGVITVHGYNFNNGTRYWYDDLRMKAVADNSPTLVQYDDSQYRFYNGNSKATAIFASHLVNCFDEKKHDFDMKKLKASAEKYSWNDNKVVQSDFPIPVGKVNNSVCYINDIFVDDILLDVFKIRDISLLREYYWTHPLIGINGSKAFQIIQMIEQKYHIKLDRKDIFLKDFLDYISFKIFLKENWK